jgi:hypothetical protein
VPIVAFRPGLGEAVLSIEQQLAEMQGRLRQNAQPSACGFAVKLRVAGQRGSARRRFRGEDGGEAVAADHVHRQRDHRADV